MVIESSADSAVADLLLYGHILAGLLALAAGLGAIVTAKGRRRHNAAGKLYVGSMAVVVVSAVPLAVWIENWFLLAIAVFSGYLVFGGYRIVQRRRRGLAELTPVDYAGHGTMILAGAVMIAAGGWQTATGSPGAWPALAVFGGIGAAFATVTLAQFRAPPAARTPWITWHIGFMGGAYIATVTATVTVNLTMLPPLVRWLGPTAVGVPLIVYATGKYEPKFAPASRT